MHADVDLVETSRAKRAPAPDRADLVTLTVSSELAEVEQGWRRLEDFGVESPGQNFDFIRSWTKATGLPRDRQVYLVAHAGARPVALLALQAVRRFGARVLTFIPGSHVGCNAPLIDTGWLETLDADARKALWRRVFRALPRADAVYLPAVPSPYLGKVELFEGIGTTSGSDALYRSEFSSWAECDATMRKSKQRKRDRQQGEKLEALGQISYGTAQPHEYGDVLTTMFRQKAERFAVLGIDDPFADPKIRAVFLDVIKTAETLKPELFVLRLDGEIAAVRYGLGHGEKVFALISAMSEDPLMQTGSPGRQEIFRTVQSVFDRGYRMLDLGLSINDEKHSWCNRELTVRTHYFPRTPAGWLFMQAQRGLDRLKLEVKTDERLFGFYKRIRGVLPAALRT
ncbi:MAG: GNAT family N-acetyltransferase [Cucumibacter sp.]